MVSRLGEGEEVDLRLLLDVYFSDFCGCLSSYSYLTEADAEGLRFRPLFLSDLYSCFLAGDGLEDLSLLLRLAFFSGVRLLDLDLRLRFTRFSGVGLFDLDLFRRLRFVFYSGVRLLDLSLWLRFTFYSGVGL